MLKKRIIPTLLYKELGLVKGSKFNSWRRVGPVLPAIKVYNAREVDELIFLDIEATNNNSEIDFQTIKEFSKFCFVPLTIGGGIKNLNQVKKLFDIGADKISINSSSYDNPQLIEDVANEFGSQSIVASIDAKKIDGKWVCFSNSGTKNRNIDPIKWSKTLENFGAGEILINSIENDGTMNGYELDLIAQITVGLDIPVIASGGAGKFEDLYSVIEMSGAAAAAAASIFHFTEITPNSVKEFLKAKGVPTRKRYLDF